MSIHATQGMYDSMHVGVLPSKHPIANTLWANDQRDTIHCILLPHCLIVLQWRQQDVALGLFVLVDPVSRGLATLVRHPQLDLVALSGPSYCRSYLA